ncbi:MAG: flagellar export chaperone FliS [Desulforhopalus sp.]|nr:flagellar export chaperone FliS [Desulforhopalus sp.]
MNPYSINQYQNNHILTASPEQILLMLYDGAIRFTRQAIQGIEKDDMKAVHLGIKKSMAIITEFANSLNHDIGGEIAENLDALYSFMIRELTLANLQKDVEKLQAVEKLLVDLRATWGEAVELNKQQVVPAEKMIEQAAEHYRSGVPANYAPLSISR